jgi:hypothetical protein
MRYWWGECDCGMGDDIEPLAHLSTCILLKPNFLFKPTGFEISWYKYPLRDSWSNHRIAFDDFRAMIDQCIKSLKNNPCNDSTAKGEE